MSTLTITKYTMPAASLGRENPLPDLKSVADAHAKIEIDETTVSREESQYMGWGRVNTILPYTIQDGYNRSRRSRAFKAFVLENEYLRATFLPQLGGRLWSLFDKEKERELLHVNPVFQPCNLALRNAWISGGVEWNVGMIGHTPFTVDDMACQQLALGDGTPVLRMFQYERVRHLFYRIDTFLPDGARELYVRVRIDNASKEDTAVYWWSNMAVNEGEDVRVVVPAEKAFRYGYGGKLAKVPVPYMTAEADKLKGEAARLARENGGTLDWDITRTTTLPQSMDFFFDVSRDARPFIAAPGKDGYGMCQTSTGELRGRKLFVWGMGTGGPPLAGILVPEGKCLYRTAGRACTDTAGASAHEGRGDHKLAGILRRRAGGRGGSTGKRLSCRRNVRGRCPGSSTAGPGTGTAPCTGEGGTGWSKRSCSPHRRRLCQGRKETVGRCL